MILAKHITLPFLLLILFFGISASSFSQLSSSNKNLLTKDLSNLINTYRIENGLIALENDPILEKAAFSQCEYMVKNDTLTHAQKKGTLRNPAKRVRYFKGKKFLSVGENVLRTPVESFRLNKKEIAELASTIFNQWKNSPAHNANILGTEYTFTGLSIKENLKKNRIFAAQVFARKGVKIEGQVSSNGFGLRQGPENCEDQYGLLSNLILNIGNSIRIEGDEIVFYFHNITLFKEIFNSSNDGIAIDLVERDQFPCLGANELDLAKVYDGILLKPVYRDEILANNRADNPRHIVTTIGKLPEKFQAIDEDYIRLSTVLINNGKACKYLIECIVPAQEYELLHVDAKLIDPQNAKLAGRGVRSMEQLVFEFNSSEITSNNHPKITRSSEKIVGITIQSYSSVEGDSRNNEVLHEQRAVAIRSDLMSRFKVRSNQIQIDSKVNWERMRFQLLYAGADSIATLSNDSIRELIASGDSTLNWDSLLYVQRTATATIFFEDKSSEPLSLAEQTAGQLAQAIAQQNYANANKCLKTLYEEDDIMREIVFSEGVFDALKSQPELVQNSAALLTRYCSRNLYKSTEFIFSWMNRVDELNDDTRHNLLILYTKVGVQLLEKWDVSAKNLANVVHPLRMDVIVPEITQDELLLNTHLVYIRYFGQINDGTGIAKSFDFIADYFKPKALSKEDDNKLALFFNNWSTYDRTVDYLLAKYNSDELNEDGLFILVLTMNFLNPEHSSFEEINLALLEKNKVRWCEWIDIDYQSLRNTKLKSMYCESCN